MCFFKKKKKDKKIEGRVEVKAEKPVEANEINTSSNQEESKTLEKKTTNSKKTTETKSGKAQTKKTANTAQSKSAQNKKKTEPQENTKSAQPVETSKKSNVAKTNKKTEVVDEEKQEEQNKDEKKETSLGKYVITYDKENKLWKIKRDGTKRVIGSKRTKKEAIERVKELSLKNEAGYVVKKKDGKFQKK